MDDWARTIRGADYAHAGLRALREGLPGRTAGMVTESDRDAPIVLTSMDLKPYDLFVTVA